jgi:TrmH family RNA methyltransferase
MISKFPTFALMKQIQSFQNNHIKNILKLQEKSRERKKQGLFVIEGKREIELAFKGNYRITSLLFVSDKVSLEFIAQFKEIELIEISQEVYQKIAYRESTEGVIAIAESKNTDLESLQFKNKKPLLLVIQGIEKPGNIGAMLRTADAANIDAIILADAKTDVYNPNVIRSSVGCIFTNQLVVATSEEIIRFFKDQNIKTFAATLQNSNSYTEQDYKEASAIIVGTEAIGLTQIWRDTATKNINIPMQGEIDSMNVSVAAAVLLFEAKRQRKFK